ncbi:MAG: BON domain-containing protein [Gemmataceae bacterium]
MAGAGVTTYRGPSSSFTTYGTYRNPSYITTLDESIPIVAHAAPELQRNLQTMLDNSAALRKLRGLDVAVDSGTVVLRGAVTSERERKLVEGMVRLTPGVRDVRNELSVVK